jgi:hypothetical protein
MQHIGPIPAANVQNFAASVLKDSGKAFGIEATGGVVRM